MANSQFKKGDQVRQIVPIIQGEVKGFHVDQETGERQILVEYPDPTDSEGDGDYKHTRWFRESELEQVPVLVKDDTPKALGASVPGPGVTTATASVRKLV